MATATTAVSRPLEVGGVEINVDALIQAIPNLPASLGARELVMTARGLTECRSAEDYELAGLYFEGLRKLERDAIPAHFEPYRLLFYTPYQAVNDLKKRSIDAVATEAKRLEGLMLGWKREEEKKRREEQERIRREQEAKRQAEIEQMRKQAEAEAAEKEAAGDVKGAQEVIAEAIETEQAVAALPQVEVILPSAVPTSRETGTTTTVSYSAEVTDLQALVTAAAANWAAYGHLLAINQPMLNNLAKAQKDAFGVPGCKLVKTESVRRTGRR